MTLLKGKSKQENFPQMKEDNFTICKIKMDDTERIKQGLSYEVEIIASGG